MNNEKTFAANMVANNLTPAYPTHPGEIIKDEVEYRGISQRQLAKQMGIASSALNEILNGHRPLTEKTALLLEAALGIICHLQCDTHLGRGTTCQCIPYAYP